jgi:glutathione synthase/RimK-type ligase-like ATP-grasp enzyme
MKRIRIYPYKLYSEGARALATALDTICVKPDGRYRPRVNDLIINWGNSSLPVSWNIGATEILNYPLSVRIAVNKLDTLSTLLEANVPTVEWTCARSTADRWLSQGETIVERHNLTGTKGGGIRIVKEEGYEENFALTSAPLYTKLIPRAREYRVHVFDGHVIDLQQKKRREGNDSDGTIKNLDNGWVFVRDDITPPPRSIFDVAVRAVQALGLDFGGVDIITKDGQCYVLEVNCAVGLEGSTINSYVNAINRYANRE